MGRKRQNPLARYGAVMGICALAGAVAGGIAGAMSEVSDGGALRPLVIAVVAALAMAVCLWACGRWWRGLDEAAQEAHKWAWWWGSTVGLALGGVVPFVLLVGDDSWTVPGDPRDLLLLGGAFVFGVQALGYAVAWAAWWLKRR